VPSRCHLREDRRKVDKEIEFVLRALRTRLITCGGGDNRTIANLPEDWPEDVEADESGLESFGEQKRSDFTRPSSRSRSRPGLM